MERNDLLDELDRLRSENRKLEQRLRIAESARPPTRSARSGLDVARVRDELKRIVVRFHPDKNPGGLDANAVCAELNSMRDRIDEPGGVR